MKNYGICSLLDARCCRAAAWDGRSGAHIAAIGRTADAAHRNPLAPKKPPLPAKAKRVLHLFMNGGASHVDTFDPKPSLAKFAGKPIPITLKTERRTGAAFPSPFTFQQVRPERHRSQRDLFECRRLRRRPVHRPLDAHRHSEPRAVADDDELRRRAPGAARASARG